MRHGLVWGGAEGALHCLSSRRQRMQVHILFFGALKDVAERATDTLSLPDEARLQDVLDYYQEKFPGLKDFVGSMAMSVNQEYAGPATQLKSGDEIGLLPPVSGGAILDREPNSRAAKRAMIVREKIDAKEVLARLHQPEDGAAVIFEGVVRNHTRGRRTLFLDYEAYEEMAEKQLEALSRQALDYFEVREVAVVHRLGRLEVGETSVLIAVAARHRAAAFDACRWLIEELKRTVPIWKKEHFEDGAVWAAGEPFPPAGREDGQPFRIARI